MAKHKHSVVAELSSVVDIAVSKDDTLEDIAENLARAANELKDDCWASLSEPTQAWVNLALEAIQAKKEVPMPEGIEDFDFGSAEEEVEESQPVKKEVKEVKKAKAAKVPKPTKAAPPKTRAKSVEGERRGPKHKYPDTAKIVVLAKENPYRENCKSYTAFAKYQKGMTIAEMAALGVTRDYIRWDLREGYIALK